MPKVRVILPTHNYDRFPGEAIQSVLDQTFEDFDGWFRGSLRQSMTCHRLGYNSSKLERLMMQHINGADNLSRHIGAFVTLELWRRHLD